MMQRPRNKTAYILYEISFTHNNHVSTVPKHNRFSCKAFSASVQLSNIQRNLTALKYVEMGKPQIF